MTLYLRLGTRPGPVANNPLDGAPARGYMKIIGT